MSPQTPQTPQTPHPVRSTSALTAEETTGVRALVRAARAADGGEPLAEDARLALEERGPSAAVVTHLLAGAPAGAQGPGAQGPGAQGPPAGYAQVRTSEGRSTVELLVAPGLRRSGVGTALAQAVRATLEQGAGTSGEADAWSHGDHPGAAALAARHRMARVRELLRMERTGDAGALPPLELPDGVALRAFEPGRDDAAWLALNAAAFADHPEQGAWDSGDLDARLREPWFEAAGLLLLEGADDPGRLLASHWTKVTDPVSAAGEVYVVAVAPEQQGRGLGRAVVLAGLHHLADRGIERVELYVEGDNAAALRTYQRLGFTRVAADVAYRRTW